MGTGQVAAEGRAALAPLFAHGGGCMEDEVARRRTRRAVARATAGDREALRELYERYSCAVYRQVRAVVRDEHEAQDITQLVFLKLIGVLPRYDERQGPFAAWLLRVARNLAIDQARRRRPVPAEAITAPAACDGTGADRAQALHDALAGLSSDQRQVLVLRQILGLGPREIAERLHRTEGSVHALHHRAREAMQASLLRAEAGPATRGRPRAGRAGPQIAAGRRVSRRSQP
jgi:RNA polymerase sigma-70 factor (ECF subfamily)